MSWYAPLGMCLSLVEAYYRDPSTENYFRLVNTAQSCGGKASPFVRGHPALGDDRRVQQHLARALFSDGEVSEALYLASRVVHFESDNLTARFLLAEILERYRFVDTAHSNLDLLRILLRRSRDRRRRRALRIPLLELRIHLFLFVNDSENASRCLIRLLIRGTPARPATVVMALKSLDVERHARLLITLLDKVDVSRFTPDWVPVLGKKIRDGAEEAIRRQLLQVMMERGRGQV